ncbi:epithelial-stromal interaction protein 1 [Genypterus blacodes]|uniref:epithelial-stromal interaction protein 1 n=1 Tax=Genypterus blacodes TaxID=154954 RepID=UPI003F76302B
MDPYHNHGQTNKQPTTSRNQNQFEDDVSGDESDQNPNRTEPDIRNPPVTPRQNQPQTPQYASGFTMVAPNESRRTNLMKVAQKGEEDLQKWREANRVTSVQETPERLGGNVTMAEARNRQFGASRNAKLQKKIEKQDLDKKKRQEEEEQLQRMKDIQRGRGVRLEQSNQEQERRRREQFRQDQLRKSEMFLQKFERTAQAPLASSCATHTSPWSEAVENKPSKKSQKDLQLDHSRVNSAFLDKLEGQSRGSKTEVKTEAVWEEERPCLSSAELGERARQSSGQDATDDPEQTASGWADEADYDWDLEKLVMEFPNCSRIFLEDIIDQCDGDYEKVVMLLS